MLNQVLNLPKKLMINRKIDRGGAFILTRKFCGWETSHGWVTQP